jgi:hypothetical protein
MKILNGWKEIGECLHRTPRSAQRWERLGLPVRRISNSSHSPIIAYSDEIERWARAKATLSSGDSLPTELVAFRATRRETRELVKQLRAARIEHKEAVEAIRGGVAAD